MSSKPPVQNPARQKTRSKQESADLSASDQEFAEDIAASEPPQTRQYVGQASVDHDLFRLKPTTMKKNVGYQKQPNWENVMHEHFFHSVDSNGIPQECCAAIGGHTHQITVENNGPDHVPSIVCGPAAQWVRDGDGKRFLEPLKFDAHTHETQYIRSERIQVREINAEFLKLQSKMDARRPSPRIEGIAPGKS